MALTDLIISPGYQQKIPDDMWIEVSRSKQINCCGETQLTIEFRTKDPCFNPEDKYQCEPDFQIASQDFILSKKYKFWTSHMGVGLSKKLTKTYAGKLNRDQGRIALLKWWLYLIKDPTGMFDQDFLA